MSDQFHGLFGDLADLQYRRKFYIARLNMMENALRALVRRAMGWHGDMPEAERDKINTAAAKLVAKLVSEAEVKEGDREIAALVSADVEVFRQSREPLLKACRAVERDMVKLIRPLAAMEWARQVRGFGELGCAVILAETGDLSAYPNPAKVWRRLGLAPFKGKAGKTWRIPKWTDGETLTAAEWIEFGYSGKRRAQVWGFLDQNVERSMDGKYRALYDYAKAAKVDLGWAPIHAQAHARRVVAKEIVLDLWRVWHGFAPRRRACGREDQQVCDAQRPSVLAAE